MRQPGTPTYGEPAPDGFESLVCGFHRADRFAEHSGPGRRRHWGSSLMRYRQRLHGCRILGW